MNLKLLLLISLQPPSHSRSSSLPNLQFLLIYFPLRHPLGMFYLLLLRHRHIIHLPLPNRSLCPLLASSDRRTSKISSASIQLMVPCLYDGSLSRDINATDRYKSRAQSLSLVELVSRCQPAVVSACRHRMRRQEDGAALLLV